MANLRTLTGLGFLLACALSIADPTLAQDASRAPRSPGEAIRTLTLDRVLESRGRLGGVCVDRLGFAYVSNFRDRVWRISPEGEVKLLADSLSGSSGNAIDPRGDLLQAEFSADRIIRIRRTGEVEPLVTSGLEGPIGIAVDGEGTLFVCNCRSNSIVRVKGSETRVLASGSFFRCPNGITLDDEGNLYVTNFNSDDVIRVRPDGKPEVFATVGSSGGNAHIAFLRGQFFVTDIRANLIFRVSSGGEVTRLAGTGTLGHTDGPANEASLSHPNGIGALPGGTALYFNDLDGEWRGNATSRIVVRLLEIAPPGSE